MEGRALTVGDLRCLEQPEPRIQDLAIARRLGIDQRGDVRKLIVRNKAELESHGPLFTKTGKHTGVGRRGTEYWLNEAQTLLVCIFSRTPAAAEVRREVIQVFMAWRHGGGTGPAANSSSSRRWSETSRRHSVASQVIGFSRSEVPEALAENVTYLPVWSNGRRPRFWHDRDVREAVIAQHRQMTIDMARAELIARFGRERTPSRSSLARFWLQLDEARALRP